MLTKKELRAELKYDPETGIFTWRKPKWGRVVGNVTGCPNERGYLIIIINGKRLKAHRLAWLYVTGEWPDEIDHINRKKDDNRFANLRVVDRVGQMNNIGMFKNNTTGYPGVYRKMRKGGERWEANIMLGGKLRHLGTFLNKEDAITAREKAWRDKQREISRSITLSV